MLHTCSSFVFRLLTVMAKEGYSKITPSEDKGRVSFVSLLFFQWMNSIFKTGSERPLDENDLLLLSKENSACFLTDQLQAKWNKEKTKCNRNQKRPKLWKCVIKLISVKDAIIIVFTIALLSVSIVLQPLLLGYLISILMSSELQNDTPLYGCALALCINPVIGALCMHYFDYRCELLGIRISCALKGLIYSKVSSNSVVYFIRGCSVAQPGVRRENSHIKRTGELIGKDTFCGCVFIAINQ